MVRLGDICTIQSGGTPSRHNKAYWDDGTIPWVKISDIKDKYLDATEERITKLGLENSSAKIFPAGTILYTIFATLGEVCILNIEAATNQAISGIQLESEQVDKNYLYHYLSSLKSIVNNIGRGVAQNNINMTILRNFEIPLPSLEEQRKIAAVLDKVSDLIAKRRTQLDKLDELVKSRFIEMFGMPGTDAFGWGMNRLGNACYINPKKGQDTRLVKGLDVSFVPMPAVTEHGEIDASARKKYEEVKTGFTYFAEHDVLFAKITPCMENGKGAIARNLCNGIGFGSTEFHVLRPIQEKTNPHWIYTLTSFSQFREDAANNMTGSAGQRRVPVSFLENYLVSVPPLELQNRFATFVARTDKSKLAIQKSLEKLEILKKSLMQKYFD